MAHCGETGKFIWLEMKESCTDSARFNCRSRLSFPFPIALSPLSTAHIKHYYCKLLVPTQSLHVYCTKNYKSQVCFSFLLLFLPGQRACPEQEVNAPWGWRQSRGQQADVEHAAPSPDPALPQQRLRGGSARPAEWAPHRSCPEVGPEQGFCSRSPSVFRGVCVAVVLPELQRCSRYVRTHTCKIKKKKKGTEV